MKKSIALFFMVIATSSYADLITDLSSLTQKLKDFHTALQGKPVTPSPKVIPSSGELKFPSKSKLPKMTYEQVLELGQQLKDKLEEFKELRNRFTGSQEDYNTLIEAGTEILDLAYDYLVQGALLYLSADGVRFEGESIFSEINALTYYGIDEQSHKIIKNLQNKIHDEQKQENVKTLIDTIADFGRLFWGFSRSHYEIFSQGNMPLYGKIFAEQGIYDAARTSNFLEQKHKKVYTALPDADFVKYYVGQFKPKVSTSFTELKNAAENLNKKLKDFKQLRNIFNGSDQEYNNLLALAEEIINLQEGFAKSAATIMLISEPNFKNFVTAREMDTMDALANEQLFGVGKITTTKNKILDKLADQTKKDNISTILDKLQKYTSIIYQLHRTPEEAFTTSKQNIFGKFFKEHGIYEKARNSEFFKTKKSGYYRNIPTSQEVAAIQ